jgi:hypothetical protein
MVATTHMLVAGALALKARSLKHGLTIGVLSHLILDAVPHRDYRWDAFGGLALGVDLTGGALAVGKLSGGSRVVLAGALGGVLPDIVRPAERALHLKLTTPLHDTIHTASRPSAWSAVAVQGLTVASAVLLLRGASCPASEPRARTAASRALLPEHQTLGQVTLAGAPDHPVHRPSTLGRRHGLLGRGGVIGRHRIARGRPRPGQ